MSNTNIVTTTDNFRKSIVGIQKHFPNGVTLGGKTYTTAALVAVLQGYIDAATASQEARATWLDNVAATRTAASQALPVHRKLLTYVATTFGDAQGTLADFGSAPATRKVPTVETKVAAKQKRAATRTARHTMGKNQKKSVTGAVVPTAAAAPSTAATPTAPPGPATTAATTGTSGGAPHA
jgi:hypothetical protein